MGKVVKGVLLGGLIGAAVAGVKSLQQDEPSEDAARPTLEQAAETAREKATKAAEAARPALEQASDAARAQASKAADAARARLEDATDGQRPVLVRLG